RVAAALADRPGPLAGRCVRRRGRGGMSAPFDIDEQERPIDRAFARWVRRHSGSELLERAALAVSRAEGQGHACAALAEESALVSQGAEALRDHPWVGDGSTVTPFVLD